MSKHYVYISNEQGDTLFEGETEMSITFAPADPPDAPAITPGTLSMAYEARLSRRAWRTVRRWWGRGGRHER